MEARISYGERARVPMQRMHRWGPGPLLPVPLGSPCDQADSVADPRRTGPVPRPPRTRKGFLLRSRPFGTRIGADRSEAPLLLLPGCGNRVQAGSRRHGAARRAGNALRSADRRGVDPGHAGEDLSDRSVVEEGEVLRPRSITDAHAIRSDERTVVT